MRNKKLNATGLNTHIFLFSRTGTQNAMVKPWNVQVRQGSGKENKYSLQMKSLLMIQCIVIILPRFCLHMNARTEADHKVGFHSGGIIEIQILLKRTKVYDTENIL